MHRQRVLIVEDDQDFSRLLSEMLLAAGYDVAVRDSAFGVAALVRREHPAAILLDLGLPYRPGSTLFAELMSDRETASVPVVVMSGFPEALSEERQAMATAILAKPFRRAQLLNALRRACAHERRN